MEQQQTIPVFKPRLRHIGRFRYLVESETRKGIGYQVCTLTMKCGCPAGKHARRCKHLVLAIQFENWRRRQGMEP